MKTPSKFQFLIILFLYSIILGIWSCAKPDQSAKSTGKISFPPSFMLGVSSSAYQIEGASSEDGKGESNWDRWVSLPGNVLIRGNVAADHYHHMEEDVKMLKQLGVRTYRFSIAWTRIYPEGQGQINPQGIEFYKKLVHLLKQNGIEPIVTLYHWDLPQKLESIGGWTNPATIDAYLQYAITMFQSLGPDVQWWTTFNEPWVTCFMGYWIGTMPPGKKDLSLALQAAHNILLAHGKTVSALRRINPNAKIGITLDLQMAIPADSSLKDDQKAAQIVNNSHHAWFADPIYFGQYPQDIVALYKKANVTLPSYTPDEMNIIHQPIDYLGLNYYYTELFKMSQSKGWWPYGVEKVTDKSTLFLDRTIQPEGLYTLLKYLDRKYMHPSILITENGCSTNDFVNYKGEINDEERIEHIYQHLGVCKKAMNEGVHLLGYIHWSFLDDYEWGTFGRMGMVYVNFQSQQRIIKKSGTWFARCMRANTFTLDY